MPKTTVSRRASAPKPRSGPPLKKPSPAQRKSRTIRQSPIPPAQASASKPCCQHCGQPLSKSYQARALRVALAEITAEQFAKRERGIEVRRYATACAFGLQFERWWAIAFRVRFRKHFAEGHDLSSIKGYDTVAASVAAAFPEFDDDPTIGTGEGAERLWDFLMSPHDPMPARDKLLAMARERVANQAQQAASVHTPSDDTPF